MHIPVLLTEILHMLQPSKDDEFIDATFGFGGHSMAILNVANCNLLAIDRDPDAIQRAKYFYKTYKNRFDFRLGKFSEILENLPQKFNKILFDFGISSMQLEDAERGFSFCRSGPLDMRMSQTGISAFDVINNFSVEDLTEIILQYGEEPKAHKISEAIVTARQSNPIKTTTDLRNIIIKTPGLSVKHKKYSNIDPATKTFQAIRIFVNDELKEIDSALNKLPNILVNNALIATISFHALEDRIVKKWAIGKAEMITKHVITPTKDEIMANPRARSAKLRVYRLK